MTIEPPRYEWTASTAREALTVLEAAKKLIEAHVMSLEPDRIYPRAELLRMTPVGLHLELDLSAAVQAVNDRQIVNEIQAASDN
ncbi:hypothetical protein [Streptomyces sp. NPDC001404]|uniref:hypothetical protein n=1 Tax=Streptomyces sp. NPDC001404 TaxID=3364571 RepID=UPI003683F94C